MLGDGQRNRKNGNLKIIIVIIVLILILIAIPIFLYIFVGHYDDWDFIGMRQKKIEEGWLVRISSVHRAFDEGRSTISLSIFYSLGNTSKGIVRDIYGRFHKERTVIFFDNDFDDKLGVGDTFFIYDNPDVNIKLGTMFKVWVGGIVLD